MDTGNPNLVEIFRAKNLAQAHAMRIALEAAGIEARIEGELLQGAVGELPIGWNTAPRILVDESQAVTARQIVERADVREGTNLSDADSEEDVARCLACGALMEEGQAKCSACGWTYTGEQIDSDAVS